MTDIERECLRCFSVDYNEFKARIPDRTPQTCEWFLKDPRYVAWQDGPKSSILWVSGHAGCGKSVFSSFLVNHLQESIRQKVMPRNICFFFCNEQADVNQILCAILHQLMSMNRLILRKHVLAEFEARGPKIVKETATLCAILQSISADQMTGDTMCILDALDELPDSERYHLVRGLLSCPKQWLVSSIQDRPLFKIFVTSRPYETIENDLCRLQNVRIKLEDELKNLDADITRVINHRLNDLQSLTGSSQAAIDRIRPRLTAGSEHTFLWVTIVLDLLEQSSEMSETSIAKYIIELPSALNKLYDKILEDQPDPEKTRRLLCVIMAACRPLQLSEINLAIHVRETDGSENDIGSRIGIGEVAAERMIRKLCGPLIRISRSTVSFIHFTVKEHLNGNSPVSRTSHDEVAISKFNIPFHMAHQVFAEICVRYLLFNDFEQEPPPNTEGVALLLRWNRLYCAKHKLFSYASSYWVRHVQAAEVERNPTFLDLLWRLCDGQSPRFDTIRTGYLANFYQVMSCFTWCGTSSHSQKKWILRIPQALKNVWLAPLLCRKAALEAENNHMEKLALHTAIYQGSKSSVEMLLAKGEFLDESDPLGAIPLHAAVLMDDRDVLMQLLSKDVGIDACNEMNRAPLHVALMTNRPEIAQILITHGANTTAVTSDGSTPLHLLAGLDSVFVNQSLSSTAVYHDENRDRPKNLDPTRDLLSMLFESRVDINAKDINGQTPLHVAILSGHFTVAEALVSNGADVQAQDKLGRTALMNIGGSDNHLMSGSTNRWSGTEGETVCSDDEIEMLALLLIRQGAKFLATDNNLCTPLHHAARYGSVALTRVLLDQGADIEACDCYMETPLIRAACHGNSTVVRLLLLHKANIEARNRQQMTSLLFAAIYGYDMIVQLLLQNGANIEAQDEFQCTSLHYAAIYEHDATIQLLLQNDANIEAQAQFQRTSLHHAAFNGKDVTIQLLLQNGANIEAQDQFQRTSLHHAAFNEKDVTIQLLLQNGANIEAQDQFQSTSLHHAAFNGKDVTIQLLLQNGANIEAQGQFQCTSLHYAAFNGKDVTIQLLLQNGANIEAQDDQEQTPLLVAISKGHEKSVHILIENKANVYTRTDEGTLPLHLAILRGHKAITRLLLKQGQNIDSSNPADHRVLQISAENGHEGVLQMLVDENYVDAEVMTDILEDAEEYRRWNAQMPGIEESSDTEQKLDMEQNLDSDSALVPKQNLGSLQFPENVQKPGQNDVGLPAQKQISTRAKLKVAWRRVSRRSSPSRIEEINQPTRG